MTLVEYNTCVDQHADGLYRFILKQVRDADDARDVVQEAFARVWERVGEVPFEKAKTYLFTTGYRVMIDGMRKAKRRRDYADQTGDVSMRVMPPPTGLKSVLEEALQKLPEVQRTVVLLRDYEGYAYDQIGEITGLTESQVKVYIFRARVSLRNYIGKLENVL